MQVNIDLTTFRKRTLTTMLLQRVPSTC